MRSGARGEMSGSDPEREQVGSTTAAAIAAAIALHSRATESSRAERIDVRDDSHWKRAAMAREGEVPVPVLRRT